MPSFDINTVVRIVKKLFLFWKSSQNQQHHQQQHQQKPHHHAAPPKPQPPYPYQSIHPTVPASSSYPANAQQPPSKHEYQHHDAGRPQQPFQGHATHVGPHHDKNPAAIAQSSSYYTSLRNSALHESHEMCRCFDEAHTAYEGGDGAKAKELSNEGHEHQRKRDEINSQAADWIFHENNKNSPEGEIDLHGLYVKEALHYSDLAIKEAQSKNLPELKLVVGKGIHSAQHVQKIKPAVEDLMRKYRLSAHIDPENTGVLVVKLNAADTPDFTWTRDLDVGRQLNERNKDEGCLIM